MKRLSLVLMLAAYVAGDAGVKAATALDCAVAAIQAKAPAGTTITAAVSVQADGALPAYCKVEGHVATPGNTVNFRLALPASWNVPPTRRVYAVRDASTGRELTTMSWGLVPSWAPDASRAANAINARVETLHEKPTWRHLLAQHRCIVPMTGYYEWATTGGSRQPWYVHREDGLPAAAAGLWSRWRDGLETCAVITREADARLGAIHHRMPVMLDHGDVGEWLSDRKSARLNSSHVSESRMPSSA